MLIKSFFNKANFAKLGSIGFLLNPFADSTDKHRVVFYKSINHDLIVELLFQKRGIDQLDVIIFLSSKSVTSFLNQFAVPQPGSSRAQGRPECVLVVDLAWLVWNRNPESWQKGQFPYYCREHSDISKVLSDYDDVGLTFVNLMATENNLAVWLADLKSYPVKVSVPGGLRSTDPFVYSALLYLAQRDITNAEAVLNKGTVEYEKLALEGDWRKIKLDEFNAAKLNILNEMKYIHK